ncbi:hypothetical protein L218DRAFT_621556 [Marasmius fiardii PR-910]|nr:hypothetical protein L218DRAFT_621556 [Marasmius fiardii PR-910]
MQRSVIILTAVFFWNASAMTLPPAKHKKEKSRRNAHSIQSQYFDNLKLERYKDTIKARFRSLSFF